MVRSSQSVVDTLVDCLMLSPHPAAATISHRVDVKAGRKAQVVVDVAIGGVRWTLAPATAGNAARQLNDAATALRQKPLRDPARRMARAATAAFAQAAQMEEGRA